MRPRAVVALAIAAAVGLDHRHIMRREHVAAVGAQAEVRQAIIAPSLWPAIRNAGIAEDVAELGTVESQPRQDGRNMVMVIGPLRTKADARADQRKNSEDSHRERQGGGSRRDQAAREAKARAAEKAAANAAPVKNSVGDAFPEQLKAMAARTQESAPAAPAASAEPKQAPKAPAKPAAQAAPKQAPKRAR